ncbi:hypothetical protein VTJ49DRAFT_1047 [Mycothermus thermophilus]|uniref:Uncharacterized protein n=1 Tax=Humicola insolens TaxID=85995 RepID=A0ABR3VEM3_HUMIN
MICLPANPPAAEPAPSISSFMDDADESNNVTTLRLPKGQVSAAQSTRSSNTPRSWSSPDLPTSPERHSSMSRSSSDGTAWLPPPAAQLLSGIGVIEVLDGDERPTFVVDLHDPANLEEAVPGLLRVVYANAALRATPALLELLRLDASGTPNEELDTAYAKFKAWAVREPGLDVDAVPSSTTYGGFPWTRSTLRRRFRVIRGYLQDTPFDTPRSPVLAHGAESHDARSTTEPASDRPGSIQESPAALSPGECSDYFGVARGSSRSQPVTRESFESTSDSAVGLPLDSLTLSAAPLRTTFDWTQIPIDDPNLSDHHRFARSIDWASTPLGPVESWPIELRIMSSMIMGSPHPAALYWGQEYVAIYNEAYISLAGNKHPDLMGRRYRDAWPEIWAEIQPVFDAAWTSAYATMKHDDLLFLSRHGFSEETYFNWAIIPLVGADGNVVALYNPAFENTRRRVAERRMHTLREIGVKTAQAKDVRGFWAQLRKGLAYNERDCPFALLYSVRDDTASDDESGPFEGSVGVPDRHPCAVPTITDLANSNEGFAPYMRSAAAHPSSPVILSTADGTMPTTLLKDVTWSGFGDPCHTIVVFPVQLTTASSTSTGGEAEEADGTTGGGGDAVFGFVVLGTNPRRPFNAEYQLFITLLSRQLGTSLASVVLLEEEIRRGRRAAKLAAIDQQKLSLQLHLRTREAVESEYRFARMAEFVPVGLFIADGHGSINYCNDMWYRISGLPRGARTLAAWMEGIRDEDRPGAEEAWRKLVRDKVPVTHEFRFRGSRELMDGHYGDVWALMSAFPEREPPGSPHSGGAGGELKHIFGCITDISQQKWAESVHKRRRDEAVEMKRQQENFIDITSHEMRNPLSAILQCADEISSGLGQYLQQGQGEAQPRSTTTPPPPDCRAMVESCVDAANTISLCASHQKRIVDDILTLSKLDSNLLLVTPVDARPVVVVRDVLKMFEAELASTGIDGRLAVEPSYTDLAVDWVRLDPSRLRQVLINLMTNAIKFTQGRPVREIVISIGASRADLAAAGSECREVDGDDDSHDQLSYVPPRQQPDSPGATRDLTDDPDWANGEKIHLHFSVRDTGPGLGDEEKRILFQRFSQASPRTHVRYGGSGLGLFICRTLTELQGGRIAVCSEKGRGSTFAFYIKARKSDGPLSGGEEGGSGETTPCPTPTPVAKEEVMPESERSPTPESPARPKETTQPAPSPSGPVPPRSPPRPSTEPASQLDILIVEDNLVNQRVLQRQLQLTGAKTHVANHGGEALDKLRHSRFWRGTDKPNPGDGEMENCDGSSPQHQQQEQQQPQQERSNISVILMDLEMPVMDGISCTREIRRLESEGQLAGHVPILAVTAYARAEQVENAMAAGVDGVIAKPFRITELLPQIERLVRRSNAAAGAPSTP